LSISEVKKNENEKKERKNLYLHDVEITDFAAEGNAIAKDR
jgi:hypothetical protein